MLKNKILNSNQHINRSQLVFILLCIAISLAGWRWFQSLAHSSQAGFMVPEFTAYDEIAQRKQAFLDYLYPLVANANIRVLQDRKQLLEIEQRLARNDAPNREQLMMLEKLALRYDIEFKRQNPQHTIDRLLKRVDVVPVSLVLAQAANETAWGTSRFATEANNYFGQWCYRKGCGLVPGARTHGKNHEVRVFSSPAESVTAYMRNLNRNRAYAELRTLRHGLRQKNRPASGHALASGLGKYSELGNTYVSSLRSIILANQLQAYTQKFYTSLADYPDLQALVVGRKHLSSITQYDL